jgi:uncharacterized membrane protein YfcA
MELASHGFYGPRVSDCSFIQTVAVFTSWLVVRRKRTRARAHDIPHLTNGMNYIVICTVALVASGLTFFSGFGLGTLLLPAFALFFPISDAVALTAVVHSLNGFFKLALVGHNANRGIVLRFGLPAVLASFAGAWVLLWLSGIPPVFSYEAFGHSWAVLPVKLVIGSLLLVFGALEAMRFSELSFGPQLIVVGGFLSGFFGGISGMQGALRSAFLIRAGLTKEEFIGTGVVVASLIDISRIGVYFKSASHWNGRLDYWLLAAAVLSAFAGTALGNKFIKKMMLAGVQKIVAAMLVAVAVGLIAGGL